ncbi:hypothetical protein GCM10010304_73970 [Streptomyces roseoviolaceus]
MSRRAAVAAVALLVAATGTTAAARKPPPAADPRADVNQDGRLDAGAPSDEAGEEVWRPGRGAVFLAHVDDDARRCRMRPGDLDRVDPAVDERLAACHDAADTRRPVTGRAGGRPPVTWAGGASVVSRNASGGG